MELAFPDLSTQMFFLNLANIINNIIIISCPKWITHSLTPLYSSSNPVSKSACFCHFSPMQFPENIFPKTGIGATLAHNLKT